MGSRSMLEKTHAVCVPFPAQGHINPMLKLAKLLHNRDFHITFVNTESNHSRVLKSRGPDSLDGLPSFRFETIPDCPPETDNSKYWLAPFKDLLSKLSDTATSNVPPITCIISDAVMRFTLATAEELGIPRVSFWAAGACGFMGFFQYRNLVEKGFLPVKDPRFITNEYLDTIVDWIPSMQGMNLITTIIGFGMIATFIVFVCSRLICGRIRGVGSRQMSEIESRIDLEQAANIEAEGSGIPDCEYQLTKHEVPV